MSRTVTLTLLREDIRAQANIQGLTVRHTDAQLTRLVNSEIQTHRARVSAEGIENYLTHYSANMTAGLTSPFKFAVLDLTTGPSPAVVRVYGIDIVTNGEPKTLHPVQFSERSDYGAHPAEPEAWSPFQAYKVAIFPAPSAAYPMLVWYLPKLADLSADGDTFDGVEGWDTEVVWACVIRVCDRDQFPGAYSMAVAEHEKAKANVALTSKNPGRGVIRRRRDTWGERRGDRHLRRQPGRWYG